MEHNSRITYKEGDLCDSNGGKWPISQDGVIYQRVDVEITVFPNAVSLQNVLENTTTYNFSEISVKTKYA